MAWVAAKAEECGNDATNIEPFTDSIRWNGAEWVNVFEMALAFCEDCGNDATNIEPFPCPEQP